MMQNSMQFIMSGITLAALYDAMLSKNSDSEGLLFGHLSEKKVDSLEDDLECTMLNSTIAITAFVLTGTSHSFYDTSASIDKDALNTFASQIHLPIQDFQLIGWFKFRRTLPPKPTLLDRLVQKNLSLIWKELMNQVVMNQQPRESSSNICSVLESPIAAFFSHNMSDDLSHSFDYQFSGFNPKGQIVPLPLEIINLVNSSQAEYKEFAVAHSPFKLSRVLNTKYQNQTPPHVLELESFYEVSTKELTSLAIECKDSDNLILDLEEEIRTLKLQIKLEKKRTRTNRTDRDLPSIGQSSEASKESTKSKSE